eukprot:1129282-Prorocentrum_minimum.AAC.9
MVAGGARWWRALVDCLGVEPAVCVLRYREGRDGHEGGGGRGGALLRGPPLPRLPREVRAEVRRAGAPRDANNSTAFGDEWEDPSLLGYPSSRRIAL